MRIRLMPEDEAPEPPETNSHRPHGHKGVTEFGNGIRGIGSKGA